MMELKCYESSPPSHEEISHQLERMLASPDFKATPSQIAFLKFVVNQTLAGNGSQIKGYTVATEVFGRRSDFDQSIDPIVSIQASGLRRALERYYKHAGKNDSIRIDIPMGTYVPTFDEQLPSHQHIDGEQEAAVGVMTSWPTLLVRPLTNLTANPEDDYLSIGLTGELAHALSHYREIRVLEALHRDQKSPPPEMDFDFIIDGNVHRDPEGVRVAIRLCDAKKGIRIWSGKYQGDLEAAKMISFQEDVAAQAALRVAGDNAVITRHLADLFKSKAAVALTAYEAMLLYWESATLLTASSMVRAIRALEHAVAQEPDCGQVWSMLAAQYANNYGLELVDLPTDLEKAAEFAQRGVSLDPTNRRARMILAYVRFMENKLPEARCEAETGYHLCPNSLLVLDAIGWVTALAGEWERGVNWIKKAMQLNPYYRPWIRHALCFNWFRLGNYEKAYQESLHFMMPELFWDPLLKASACGHLGRIEEGQGCVRALLASKPDFAQRGRILIGRYVKFEDIADRIIEGLGKLGMSIESL
jgi:adenylate cyclase